MRRERSKVMKTEGREEVCLRVSTRVLAVVCGRVGDANTLTFYFLHPTSYFENSLDLFKCILQQQSWGQVLEELGLRNTSGGFEQRG